MRVDRVEAELREQLAGEIGGALARSTAVRRVFRDVDDVVKERRGDRVARRHRFAADADRPLGDAEAVRDVVAGIARETRAGLFEHTRQRGVVRDQITYRFHTSGASP